MKMTNQKGFTLIELLIVIGIIAILAASVIIAINPGQQFAQARDASRRSHINSIRQAVLSYQIDNQGNLPTELLNSTGGEICNPGAASCPTDSIDLSFLTPDYIASIPVDPAEEETSETTGYGIANVGNRIATWANKSEIDELGENPALKFDGVDDYIAMDMYYNGSSYKYVTAESWIKTTADNEIIISFDRSEYWRFGVGSNGTAGKVTWNVDGQDLSGNTTVNDGEWHYVAATYNGDQGKAYIYVDGNLDAEYSGLNPTFGSGYTRYGFVSHGSEAGTYDGSKGPDSYWDGELDEIKIWNKVLTQEEIKDNMKKSLHGNETGLLAYYSVNEGQGSMVYDSSGNANDGTLLPNYPDNSPEWIVRN